MTISLDLKCFISDLIDGRLAVWLDLFRSAKGNVELFMRGENSIELVPGEVFVIDGDDELDHLRVPDGSTGVA